MFMNGHCGEICVAHEIQSFLSDFGCKKRSGQGCVDQSLQNLNVSVKYYFTPMLWVQKLILEKMMHYCQEALKVK